MVQPIKELSVLPRYNIYYKVEEEFLNELPGGLGFTLSSRRGTVSSKRLVRHFSEAE